MVRLSLQTWRQARMVRKTSSLISDVKDATEEASEESLGDPPSVTSAGEDGPLDFQIPLLHRKEIQVGKLLGQGSFCQVHELTGVSLQKKLSKSCSENESASRQLFHAAFDQKQGEWSEDTAGTPRYAIKHLNHKLLKRPRQFHQAAQSLVQEAKVMAKLDHEHILKMRGLAIGGTAAFAETGRFDSFFIVTDLLSNTLRDRITEWSQDKHQAMGSSKKLLMKTNYAQQIASALEYLHDRRIIFRDCKPDNIGFLSGASSDCLQLFDFGLCRTLPVSCHDDTMNEGSFHEQEEHYLMSIAGTTRYMAGEVLTGKYNLKADCYSFAYTYYEMLGEKKPFASFGFACFEEYVHRLGKRPDLSPLGLPRGVEQLIEGSWCQDISERLSMKDISETLSLLVNDIEISLSSQSEIPPSTG
jgi:serine/threonine protein kinase